MGRKESLSGYLGEVGLAAYVCVKRAYFCLCMWQRRNEPLPRMRHQRGESFRLRLLRASYPL